MVHSRKVRERVAELKAEAKTTHSNAYDTDVVWVCEQLIQAWDSIGELLESMYHLEGEMARVVQQLDLSNKTRDTDLVHRLGG